MTLKRFLQTEIKTSPWQIWHDLVQGQKWLCWKRWQLIIWLSGNARKKLQGRGLKDKSEDFTRTNFKLVSLQLKMRTFLSRKRGQRMWVLGVVIQLSEKTFTWSDSYLPTNQPTTDCTFTNSNHTHIHHWKGLVVTNEMELNNAHSSRILNRDILDYKHRKMLFTLPYREIHPYQSHL